MDQNIENHDQSIQATLERHTLAMRRSVTRTRIGGGLALVAVGVWLTWLHGQVASMDAESVATMVEVRAQSEMPKAIDALREHVAELAPDTIAHVQAQVLELPAHARMQLEAVADAWIEENKAKLASSIAEHVQLDLSHVREDIANRYPELDEREQLKALIADFVRGYRVQVVAMLAEPSEDVERVVSELETRLLHLARGQKLSDRERLQREILATWIELAPRMEAPLLFECDALDLASLGK